MVDFPEDENRDRKRGEHETPEQPAWATSLGVDEFGCHALLNVKDLPIRMRWIPPGEFWMGSPEGESGRYSDEGPRHLVEVSHGFWLAAVPCTQDLWSEMMRQNPSRFVSPGRPVERVSWFECQAFCDVLNKSIDGLQLRLPTEAEWEYACRAGTETATYEGDLEILGHNHAPLLDSISWYGGNSGVDFDLEKGFDTTEWVEKQYPFVDAGTRFVGQKKPNSWGLFDLLGNVLEWCQDWYGPYPAEQVQDPMGPQLGAGRIFRGGSWFDRARSVRAAYRFSTSPGGRHFSLGFRFASD